MASESVLREVFEKIIFFFLIIQAIQGNQFYLPQHPQTIP